MSIQLQPNISRRQIGALPYRMNAGGLEILLVTSRETKRWIIPKGWPDKRRKPRTVAAREAFEEAGLIGKPAKRPIGFYTYEKRMPGGTIVLCEVEVFKMAVRRQVEHWPEIDQREARWFTPLEAADRVLEPGLKDIIRDFCYRELAQRSPHAPLPGERFSS